MRNDRSNGLGHYYKFTLIVLFALTSSAWSGGKTWKSEGRMPSNIVAIVIVGREISISALREWMAELGERHQVSVIAFSKLKTILQMVGLSCMLYQESLLNLDIYSIGMISLIVASILTVWTMVIYLIKAWPYLQGGAD